MWIQCQTLKYSSTDEWLSKCFYAKDIVIISHDQESNINFLLSQPGTNIRFLLKWEINLLETSKWFDIATTWSWEIEKFQS